MGFFSFGKKKETAETKNPQEEMKNTVKEWLPVKDVRDGIIHLKNGEFVKILEVIPINFKLKSKTEKRMLIFNYRSFLKGCRFPMQISIQCRKANIEPHINRMKMFYEMEKNPHVKNMIKGYINLVTEVGTKGTITRRYFVIYSFVKPIGVRDVSYSDIQKQMNDKHAVIKEYLHACGNEVLDNSDTEFTVNILYSYLNKRSCEIQKIGRKLISLMGTFLDAAEEDPQEEDEEDFG